MVDKSMKNRKSLYTVEGNLDWCSLWGKQYRGSEINLKRPVYCVTQIISSVCTSKIISPPHKDS